MNRVKRLGFFTIIFFVGMVFQFKYGILDKVVDLEDRLFHREIYRFDLELISVGNPFHILKVNTRIRFSHYKDYNAKLLIPGEYVVHNRTPEEGTFVRTGYKVYDLNAMRLVYRDLCGSDEIFITSTEKEISPRTIFLLIIRNDEVRYQSKEYLLETVNGKTFLIGTGRDGEIEIPGCNSLKPPTVKASLVPL